MLDPVDEEVVGYLDLPCGNVGIVRPRDRADHLRRRRIGHVEHRRAHFPEPGHVKKPSFAHDLERQFEPRHAVQVVIGDKVEGIGAVAGALAHEEGSPELRSPLPAIPAVEST